MVFGYGVMITLFAGGLSFFGYVAALIIGGDTAAAICNFISKQYNPVIIYAASVTVLLGLLCMYLAGEKSLTPDTKHSKKNMKADDHHGEK